MGVLVKNGKSYTGGSPIIQYYKMSDIIDTYYSDFGEVAQDGKQFKGNTYFPIITMDDILFYDIILSKNGNSIDRGNNNYIYVCKFKGIGAKLYSKLFSNANVYPSIVYNCTVSDRWSYWNINTSGLRLWGSDNDNPYSLRYENTSLNAGTILRFTGQTIL